MKKLIALAALGTALILSGNVMAHGSKARHGGVVQTAGDLSFELVSKDGKTTLYVDDHGKDLPTTGVSGTLTVLKGTQKTAMPLEAAGGNRLVAKGDAVLSKGSKAVAAVTFADKKVVSVRFSVK